jgi:two-component system LytT family response regulator
MIEPIRTIIADDEPLARRQLRALLQRDPQITLVTEVASGHEARVALAQYQPELVLLDIRMPMGDGFSAIEGLRKRPYVIFATAHAEHAVRAFDIEAVDYLLKPFDDERFDKAIRRAKDAIRSQRLLSAVQDLATEGAPQPAAAAPPDIGRITVHEGRRVSWVEIRDIEWIEAADYYAQVHAHGKAHLVREPLQKLEDRLGSAFLRVHRSALVNVAKIQRLERGEDGELTLVLQSGARVPVSRARRGAVSRRLMNPGQAPGAR